MLGFLAVIVCSCDFKSCALLSFMALPVRSFLLSMFFLLFKCSCFSVLHFRVVYVFDSFLSVYVLISI